MRKSPRKPPRKVMAIRGDYTEDVITQAELSKVAMLQAAAWAAHSTASLAAKKIDARIDEGARIEDGELLFDTELKMVRSRRKEDMA